ncbi:hypothetical protein [Prochlorococcus marinus]|uniref:hypothetical protein n=1 Tax=Prochlorococcus marinus TaxID=1219 RepID=UPI0022B3F615|nr:hypothetical protein [Prochlorococcus marinus]
MANVDSGEIRWIHGEEVTDIVSEYRTTIKKPSTFYEQIQKQEPTRNPSRTSKN